MFSFSLPPLFMKRPYPDPEIEYRCPPCKMFPGSIPKSVLPAEMFFPLVTERKYKPDSFSSAPLMSQARIIWALNLIYNLTKSGPEYLRS